MAAVRKTLSRNTRERWRFDAEEKREIEKITFLTAQESQNITIIVLFWRYAQIFYATLQNVCWYELGTMHLSNQTKAEHLFGFVCISFVRLHHRNRLTAWLQWEKCRTLILNKLRKSRNGRFFTNFDKPLSWNTQISGFCLGWFWPILNMIIWDWNVTQPTAFASSCSLF